MARLFVVISFLFTGYLLQAQKLYLPRDIQKAYQANTRSFDGKPGKNYCQNRARYAINLTATPPNRTINGHEEITYINNSPDTLRTLVFKLFMNIHKPGAPRYGAAGEDYLTSGVHIDSFVVNGKAQSWENNPFYFTTVPVALQEPLAAHDSLQLAIKWHYDVSLQSGREGMIDSTTFFLAYFYPRIAVYDDYQGWDVTPFNDALEFYSDFNDYTLNVQVPRNYLVWSTGTLLNPEEVLQPSFATKYQQSLKSDAIVNLVTAKDHAAKNITQQNQLNTWRFKASDIPDMALGISDHFIWDASSVVVDSNTQRRASVQAAYNDTAKDYHHMVHYGRQILNWLSFKWPGISYPYEKTTVFQGYAGMEYPMMANDESYDDTVFSRFVAMHELAHTYMPFYMGINETRFGFMDEGWATTFELLFNRDFMEREQADDFYKQFRVTSWAHHAAQNEDLPIITPGPSLSGGGLGNNQYGKPSLGYLAVKEILGDAVFKKCLHEYMNRWHGKHPIPWDFFHTFNNASGNNLDWFWNNWFFSNYYIDLAVKSFTKTTTGYSLSVSNIGGMATPFDVVLRYDDGTSETLHQTPNAWRANAKETIVKMATKKTIQSLKIDGGIFMDADESNNVWKK